jgi:hypothetical protein
MDHWFSTFVLATKYLRTSPPEGRTDSPRYFVRNKRKKSLCEVNMATYKVAQQTTRDRSCLIRHCAGWVFSHTLSHDPPRPLGVMQWHPRSQFISFSSFITPLRIKLHRSSLFALPVHIRDMMASHMCLLALHRQSLCQ